MRDLQSPVIAGIGHTEYSKDSGRSELALAVESVLAALEDANVDPHMVDGLVTSTFDSSEVTMVAGALGLPSLSYFSTWPFGGGAFCGGILDAARAIALEDATVVVVYRALNERSGWRFGRGYDAHLTDPRAAYWIGAGAMTPAQLVSLTVHRYMYEHGVANSDFGPVSVSARKFAAANPHARFFGRPVTLADHQASRWIVEPVLRLLDCCMESDGGAAVVLTSDTMADEVDADWVPLVGGALAAYPPAGVNTHFQGEELARLPETRTLAQELWKATGLTPADIDVAMLYDNFTPLVLMQLEALGFCEVGRGADFVAGGGIDLDGRLPVNTHGGQLGEAYVHGLNAVIEAVRQLRGSAVNQVQSVRHALVTGGAGLPTSGVVLGSRSS